VLETGATQQQFNSIGITTPAGVREKDCRRHEMCVITPSNSTDMRI
jgi:hypothetical protein